MKIIIASFILGVLLSVCAMAIHSQSANYDAYTAYTSTGNVEDSASFTVSTVSGQTNYNFGYQNVSNKPVVGDGLIFIEQDNINGYPWIYLPFIFDIYDVGREWVILNVSG